MVANILKGVLLGFKGKNIEKQDAYKEALKFGYQIGKFFNRRKMKNESTDL